PVLCEFFVFRRPLLSLGFFTCSFPSPRIKTSHACGVPAETTRQGLFTSTRWTMVLDAGESQTPADEALRALSELCRIYWRPIFLFLRRQGSNPDDAQDLTQGFFAHLIESRAYARADPEKGRFRSFLLGALKHFVAHARA